MAAAAIERHRESCEGHLNSISARRRCGLQASHTADRAPCCRNLPNDQLVPVGVTGSVLYIGLPRCSLSAGSGAIGGEGGVPAPGRGPPFPPPLSARPAR